MEALCYDRTMQLEFPYQIVTFLGNEPALGEPVYYGENGWYPQLAIKRRFKINDISENDLINDLNAFFDSVNDTEITTGFLVKPERMPVQVVDILNQDTLCRLHNQLIRKFGDKIVSRYPDREGDNYYAHITAEYNGEFVVPVDDYINKSFAINNIWLLKDMDDENSLAFSKIR